MGIFGGFSNMPRKHGALGPSQDSTLGPVENQIQGIKEMRQGGLGKGPTPILFPKKNTGPLPKLTPQAMWAGVIHGYSGYAKANREILRRAMKGVKLSFSMDSPWDASEKNPEALELLRALRASTIDDRAPQVTFHPPRSESRAGYRVIYTMMETEVVHPDMIKVMSQQYQECWTPTQWNANTFKKSGLTLPIRVMPLGIDPDVYYPGGHAYMPKAYRLTGSGAGKYEFPTGFLFIYVCQPSFRKGIEVVIEAFGEAFGSDPETGLIIASTAHSSSLFTPDKSLKPRIWLLNASLSEKDLAAVYRACQVYVCASRGEGWNLPLMEAAACGLPVIAPRTSAHGDLIPEGCGFLFNSDHTTVFPSAKEISPWFDGIAFPDFGERSHLELIRLLRMVRNGYNSSLVIASRYKDLVRTKYTWDAAAKNVVDRLKELCQG